MFNFMKKGNIEKDEKEKRKKEKDRKKKRERGGMTAEELLRLDEMRRSLKIRSRRKEKEKLPSGITADYSENFFAELDRDPEFRTGSLPGHTKSKTSPSLNQREVLTQSDSSEASLNSLHNQNQKILPPLPPRPPKRGILKGSKTVNNTDYFDHDTSSTSLLVRNTLQNEVITYQNIPQKNGFSKAHMSADHTNGHPSNIHLSVVNDKSNLLSVISTSPSVESLTDTTNSSFATPPFSLSPVGESQGFARSHSSVDDKNLDLPLPSIIPIQLPKPRELIIYRTPRGDFGFQLRRAIITDKLSSVNKKAVIFAEPGALIGNKNETGLLPGDILLKVNGIEVQDKSREEIIDLIKNSGSNVTVKVQPIPELCELTRRSGLDGHYVVLDDSNIRGGTLKRSGSLRFKKMTAKTEEDLANERAWLDAEKLWLVHKGGFTAVRALPGSGNQQTDVGKVKVKIEKTNEVLEVDEDDLEKANPAQLDKIEDICQLRYINESSVLYILRQRFGNNLIHTYAAGNLIVINPQCTLSIYNEKVAALFRGCKSEDMPPHIYAMAQSTYRSMLSSRKDQSIVLLGRSGSGKTHNFRHILSYLLHSAGAVNNVLNVEKLNALNTVLEAFGNARTSLNVNATRCTNLISLDFDQTGQIASLSVQMLMLEKQRTAKRHEGEGTFNIFYWLLAGAEGSLAKQLFLDSTAQDNNLFINALHRSEDRQRAIMELSKVSLALKALGFTDKERYILWCVLAAIYHLGNAGTVRVGTNKWQFADPVHSSRACRLLGTTAEELSQTLWNIPGSPSRTPSPTDKDKIVTGAEALDGFVIGLYSEVVNVVNNLINRCLTTNVHSTMSFVVVDSPGIQNPGSCTQKQGATFSDLCHNYVQERLYLLFHNVNLVAPHDRYTQEHIDVSTEEVFTEFNSPNHLVSILDKSPPSGVLKTSQTDLREVDRRGLLWLLDEETLYPNSSDETFLERLFQHYGGKEHHMFIRKAGGGHFVIQHLQGTNPVTYSAQGLLKASKENPVTRATASFLQESTKEEISGLFAKGKGGLLSAGAEGSQSLRRVSSIRRTCSVAIKRKSISLQVKFTTDSLVETLRRTSSRFVFCMLPHHNAGNTEIIPGPATGDNVLNVPLLRSQIRGSEILPAVRMFKQGFPEYYPHGEFKRRFRLLASGTGPTTEQNNSSSGVKITINGQNSEALDEAQAVEEMLLQMDVDTTSYRIGLSQVFFRAGVLIQLESQRDEKLADVIIQLQSRCRGYLARKKLAKLKVQDLAVRCIQRNVRKLMQVREWPWWRLYVKVTPLLNVHRTEEELTAKIKELETLKSTLEKLEQERNQLKLENDKLETKAWRAKKREKKNEELERLSAMKVETGVLSKYLKMKNQGLMDKPKNGEGLNGIIEHATETQFLVQKKNEVPDGASINLVSNNPVKKAESSVESFQNEILSKDSMQDPKTPLKACSQNLRKNSVGNTPTSSRRSSCDSSSRRGSIISSLNSFSNVQERILTLSQDHSQTDLTLKKTIKVNKLSGEALKIGQLSFKDREEPVKAPPKISSNLHSKFAKFEVGSTESAVCKKKTAALTTSNLGKQMEIKNFKEPQTSVAKEGIAAEKLNKVNDLKNETEENPKNALVESLESTEKDISTVKAFGLGNLVLNSDPNSKTTTDHQIGNEDPIKRAENSNTDPPEKEGTKTLDKTFQAKSVRLVKSEAPKGLESLQKDPKTNSSSAHISETKNEAENVDRAARATGESSKLKPQKKLTKKLDENVKMEVAKTNSQKIFKPEEAPKNESTKRVFEEMKKIPDTSIVRSQAKTEETETAKSELQKKPQRKIDELKKAVLKSEVLNNNSKKELTKKADTRITSEPEKENIDSIVKKRQAGSIEKNEILKPREEDKKIPTDQVNAKHLNEIKNKEEESKITKKEVQLKPQSHENEILQKELIKQAVQIQEGMTMLTSRANQIGGESAEGKSQSNYKDDISETSCASQGSGSESLSFRKDPKKLEKKLKTKSSPNECYPKTQKLLTAKPINAFEQAKLEESKTESIVSPTKVEAFLREALSPPIVCGEKEPVKTMEAVVEEILTSTSEKSKHEKPSKVRYTSKGEVICGVVSIKPSSKAEDADSLSAITLVPAFRPEKSILDEDCREMSAFAESSTPENTKPLEVPKIEHSSQKFEENARDRLSPTISDFSDDSYDHYVASLDYSLDSSYSRRRSLRSSSTPRRIFPQFAQPSHYRTDRTKEESPVVFDAGLSFDIASNRTSLRHRFKPQPAFADIKTTSNLLSMRISEFLKRTDHIMDEWKHLGKGGEDLQSLVQLPPGRASGRASSNAKSATNILIKGLLNYSKGSKTPSLRSRSLAKTSEASDRTISDIDELSEMTLDLSEERATGTMQAERLEAETAERVRLEQELAQVQNEKKNLLQTSERLEMELFYARADVNGLSESEADLEDGGGDAALYKNKCERTMRELEFTRRRLQQQHEDDLEQLVALKKQLEKKLGDAYEEVEEQRQVAAQWKRKVQKLQSETNDLRLLLEEQSSRNNLLEKKQRKFDSEIQMLQEELRSERNQKERLSREKEMAVAEKYTLDQNLSSVRLELELKEEKVSALTRELEELSRGGGTEQEVTQLRKTKHDLEMKLKEQEEELDELAGQVSMLEGNKLRLEMSLESLRKEHRREMAQRDDELDEVRANALKKIKVLESQLESEHEERTLLVREKHELERRLADAEERGRHHRAADEDALQRARRDLKKTKALLRDAQVMLERAKQDSPSKAALRALKNQLEDADLARASAVKAKQSLEAELNEVTGQLEEALRAKGDAENRCQAAIREMNSLRTQVDENEEELAELLKKYRQTVQQLSAEQLTNQETASALAEAEAERASLRDQLAELTARLEANTVVDPISGLAQKKLEIRIKELESRLELEQTTRGRLEVQITRLKENVERLNEECAQARTKEQAATDLTRKLQRSLREAKEELVAQQAKEQEAAHKKKELEKRLEAAEVEASTAKTDLRLAVKRIEDLQSAISGEIGSDSERTESDEEDSENDSLVSHVPSILSSSSRTSRTPDLTPR